MQCSLIDVTVSLTTDKLELGGWELSGFSWMWVLLRYYMTVTSGQEFTIAKPAESICIKFLQALFAWKLTCTICPIGINETKLITVALVTGKNKGDGTPKSKIPWLYFLLCSSSPTLLVTLNPNVEMPMNFSSIQPIQKLSLRVP